MEVKMTERNQYIGEIIKHYDTPSEIDKPIAIRSIRETVIPKKVGTPSTESYILAPLSQVFDGPIQVTIERPNGRTDVVIENDYDAETSYTPNETGQYTIRYKGAMLYQSGDDHPIISPFTVKFFITSVVNFDPLPKRSITDVINRVLDLAEPHMVGDTRYPRYKLDPKQAEEFSKIEAPEFAFTKHTLREILDQIGGYIHGMARLVRGEDGKIDTIRYSMYGGTEKAVLSMTKGEWLEHERKHIERILDEAYPNPLPDLILNDETLAQENKERQRALEEEIKRKQKIAGPVYRDDDDKDYLDPGCTIPYIPEV